MTPTTADSFRHDLQDAVGDAYAIEHELGIGGIRQPGEQPRARVFVAREIVASRRVVLKVLPEELAERIDADRFRREIEVAAALRHPRIVALLGAAVSGRFLYYMMPFLEAESLRDWLNASGGKLPIGEALRIGADVAAALQAAHEHGIVHRDVRPGNIFLSAGHAVLTSTGAARAVYRSLTPNELGRHALDEEPALDGPAHPCWLIGSPAYLSPEQSTSVTSIDGRSDVYALGCLLYEMLTGTRPFTGTQDELLRARCVALPEPPRRRRKEVPLELDRIVMKALATKSEARYPTAGELERALLAVSARRASPSMGDRTRAVLQAATLGICHRR